MDIRMKYERFAKAQAASLLLIDGRAASVRTVDGRVVEDETGEARGQLTEPQSSDDTGFARSEHQGRYGSLSMGQDGRWVYALAHEKVQSLRALDVDYDEIDVFTATGARETIRIEVSGSNDIAVIDGDDSGRVRTDGASSVRGRLTISDVDRGEALFRASEQTDAYGTFKLSAEGEWEYRLDQNASAVRALAAGRSVSCEFDVLSLDGSAMRRVTVAVIGQEPTVAASLSTAGVELDESVLPQGTACSGVQMTASGVLYRNLPAGSQLSLSLPAAHLTSGGEVVNWTISADGRTLAGATASRAVLDVSIDDHAVWHTQLHAPIDHGSVESGVLQFGIQARVGGRRVALSTLTVGINDDGAIADANGDQPWMGASGTLGRFGADGGYLSRVEVEGGVYDYTPTAGLSTTASARDYSYEADTRQLRVSGAFGVVHVNMETASYLFQGADKHALPVRLGYALSDADGSSASGSLRFVPPTAGSESFGATPMPTESTVLSEMMLGTAQRDCFLGTPADDFYDAGEGDDSVHGDAGDDVLYGGLGDDQMSCGDGRDILYGGVGNDRLFAGAGHDRLFGEDGDDLLEAGSGRAEMNGGAGRDTFAVALTYMARHAGEHEMIVTDFNRSEDRFELYTVGGEGRKGGPVEGTHMELSRDGSDTVLLIDRYWEPGTAGAREMKVVFKGVDLSDGHDSASALQNLHAQGVFVTGESREQRWARPNDAVPAVEPEPGTSDVAEPAFPPPHMSVDSDWRDTFLPVFGCQGELAQWFGTDSDDYFPGTDGRDRVSGGEGNDLLYGGGDDDELWGDSGFDELHGGRGRDALFGSDNGFTRLFGDEGDDILYLGADRAEMEGGQGRDTFHLGLGHMTRHVGGARETTISDFKRGEDRFVVDGQAIGEGSDVLAHRPQMRVELQRVGPDTVLGINRYWEPGFDPGSHGRESWPGEVTVIFKDIDLLGGESSQAALEKLRSEGAFVM